MHVRWGGREFTEPHGDGHVERLRHVPETLSEQEVQWIDSGSCPLVKFGALSVLCI
jgi:hypothetical protein